MNDKNIIRLEYIEIYVANIVQSAHFFQTTMNFNIVGYSDLDSRKTGQISYLLQQGNIRLLLTAALHPNSPVADYVYTHGDSIRDIAFATSNLESDFNCSINNGAKIASPPGLISTEKGEVLKASIHAFGDTLHTFIQRSSDIDDFLPNINRVENCNMNGPDLLSDIDHVAICVEEATLDNWVSFYKNTFGFCESHVENIQTEHSGMNSKVVSNKSGTVKFTIIEPRKKEEISKSQIDEYLYYHVGAGVQHVAFLSNDILKATRNFRKNGLEFLDVPDTYYDSPEVSDGLSVKELRNLKESQVLIDRNANGQLLQIFSKPIHTRPTFFVEIIQRDGVDGFGSNNIKALFKAIEQEQFIRENI